jgi:general L-amino acid transport system permease protein
LTGTLRRFWRRFFGSLGNALLTLIMLASFALVLPPLLRWALFDASFGARTPLECRAASGACWAFVHEKYRLVLFGRYPYAEQWRPLLAMLVLAVTIGAACGGRLSRHSIAAACASAPVAVAVLMWGGVLGLTYVDSNRWGGLPLTLILRYRESPLPSRSRLRSRLDAGRACRWCVRYAPPSSSSCAACRW